MTPQTDLSVHKSILVNVPQAHAYTVFTERMSAWWPLATHKIGKAAAEAVVLEPRVGGRWFERGVDGVECDWGRVLDWDPPKRFVLAWQLNMEWQFDPNLITEVEVRFIAESDSSTRVELEHRHLERLGEQGPAVRDAVDSEAGWSGMLRMFAEEAARAASAEEAARAK